HADRRGPSHDAARHRSGLEGRFSPDLRRVAARERRPCHSGRAVHDRDDRQDQPDSARARWRAAAVARREARRGAALRRESGASRGRGAGCGGLAAAPPRRCRVRGAAPRGARARGGVGAEVRAAGRGRAAGARGRFRARPARRPGRGLPGERPGRERAARDSMEAQVIRTYLETVAELPWNKRAEESLDLKRAAAILDEDHYALQDVKDEVLEFLSVRQLRQRTPEGDARGNDDDKQSKGSILLFVGPPGVGKTSIAKSIARAMGRPYVRISLGGARDEADLRGHPRPYGGAMPGRIVQGMKQAGAKNPVFLLDEVDKLGVSFEGDPAAALLEVLDPAQNDSFTDHYLGVPFDLSEVLFVATANFPQSIPGPLLDRLETVTFAGYTEREKLEIAKRYLVPRQLHENGLTPEQFTVTDAALSEIITSYTREAGVRQLEREIGKLGRKIARQIASGEVERVAVDAKAVDDLLGRPKVHPEHKAREDQVGVAT